MGAMTRFAVSVYRAPLGPILERRAPSGSACSRPAILLLVLLAAAPAWSQVDTNALRASASRSAASYESGRSKGDRLGYSGPESSGRPGVYFFNKAVKAFENEQYAFAIDMYRASASWAYKPAQYNLAVMYSRGQGVPVDLPRAMAWIALAAERGDSRYIEARDAINATLSAGQIAEANRILDTLMPVYADATALRRAMHRWRDVKRDATGSRLGFVGGLKIGAVGSSLASTSPGYEMTTAWAITGGRQNDGSLEYRQLRESSGPFDPRDLVRYGTATVGPIVALPDSAATKVDEHAPETDRP